MAFALVSYQCVTQHSLIILQGIGYTRVEMSFNGALNVKQTGHAILQLDRYDEAYLIPFPTCKVKGFLSRKLYPELTGTYHIVSSAGFVSEIKFSDPGFFSSSRNGFEAKIYQADDASKKPLYTLTGNWNEKFTVCDHDAAKHTVVRHVDVPAPATLRIPPVDEQDVWETRRAWKDVFAALEQGNTQNVMKEKTKLEEAQRFLRKKEAREGTGWKPRFFSAVEDDALFRELAASTNWPLHADRTKGVWRFDKLRWKEATRPYHQNLGPFGRLE